MRILVFQHLAIENPGVFRDLWRAAGHHWTAVELDEGEAIPDLDPFDLLVAMGGPMDVWQDHAHPWLRPEKTAIRRWVTELRRPYLGVCLGHQLLAAALGGEVGLMPRPEVGLSLVTLSEAGTTDPVLAAFGPRFPALHWHGAEVTRLPKGAVSLAATPSCGCQAMRWGRHAYGVQCHIEISADTVPDWNAIPEYRASLEAALGAGGAEALAARIAAQIDELNAAAREINAAILGLVAAA